MGGGGTPASPPSGSPCRPSTAPSQVFRFCLGSDPADILRDAEAVDGRIVATLVGPGLLALQPNGGTAALLPDRSR
jgi:hypothetical protein